MKDDDKEAVSHTYNGKLRRKYNGKLSMFLYGEEISEDDRYGGYKDINDGAVL